LKLFKNISGSGYFEPQCTVFSTVCKLLIVMLQTFTDKRPAQ